MASDMYATVMHEKTAATAQGAMSAASLGTVGRRMEPMYTTHSVCQKPEGLIGHYITASVQFDHELMSCITQAFKKRGVQQQRGCMLARFAGYSTILGAVAAEQTQPI